MHRARRLSMLLCGASLVACTHDFDKFAFDSAADGGHEPSSSATHDSGTDAAAPPAHTHGSGGAASNPDRRTDAGRTMTSADAGDRQTHDATTPVIMDAATAADTGMVADTGTVTDSGHGSHDAALDSGPADTGAPDDAAIGMCRTAWSSTSLSLDTCSTCACDSCTDPVSACLSAGSASEAQLCTDVFVCAVEHDCKDWDCYCTAPKCNAPHDSGDGPCVAQMDAAAGGTRTQVMEIRQAGDSSQPLVRAMNAIGCVLGLDSHSPGGPKIGKCDATCP